MKKLIRISTVPSSLRTLLKGQLKFMSHYFEVIGVASDGEALKEVMQNEGVKTHSIEMTRTISPFKDLISTIKLYRFLKKEKPFIVHTHTPKAGTLGMLASRLAGVPHRLHTIAGMPLLETKGAKRMLLDSVEKFTYKNATLVLPNSLGLKNIAIENKYAPKDKLKIIGNGSSNGIDVKHYDSELISKEEREHLKSELKISNTDIVFIFIGRMVKDKGVNELVAAFDKLSKMHKGCKLILMGPRENALDPLDPETETLIINNTNIIEVGLQKDIRPFVAISSVLVHPSYREGFPNVVLQGSCMGLPCIVSDINGCNEIIENEFNGLIVPPKNIEALKNAMERILKDPTIINEMAENSRSNIVKKYQQEYIWKELLTLYQSLT